MDRNIANSLEAIALHSSLPMRQSAQGAVTIAKFRAGDSVRFIGTDRSLTVTQYNPETLEYRVQRGDDYFGGRWVSEICLEAVELG